MKRPVFFAMAAAICVAATSLSSYAAGVAEQGVSRGKGLARMVVTEAGADPTERR